MAYPNPKFLIKNVYEKPPTILRRYISDFLFKNFSKLYLGPLHLFRQESFHFINIHSLRKSVIFIIKSFLIRKKLRIGHFWQFQRYTRGGKYFGHNSLFLPPPSPYFFLIFRVKQQKTLIFTSFFVNLHIFPPRGRVAIGQNIYPREIEDYEEAIDAKVNNKKTEHIQIKRILLHN